MVCPGRRTGLRTRTGGTKRENPYGAGTVVAPMFLEVLPEELRMRLIGGKAVTIRSRLSAIVDRADYLLNVARLWVLDRVAQMPETPVDRAILEEGERLRKAFPKIDFDHPRPRANSPQMRAGSHLWLDLDHFAAPRHPAATAGCNKPRSLTIISRPGLRPSFGSA
jgi:hypothetical protein